MQVNRPHLGPEVVPHLPSSFPASKPTFLVVHPLEQILWDAHKYEIKATAWLNREKRAFLDKEDTENTLFLDMGVNWNSVNWSSPETGRQLLPSRI